MEQELLNGKEKYDYENICKMIGKLSDNEKNSLLAILKMPEICGLLNNPEALKEYCSAIELEAYKYLFTADALKKLAVMECNTVDEVKEFSMNYDKLPEDTRKQVVVSLMNNHDFVRNYNDILVRNYDRVVKSNETTAALDRIFGVGKLFRKWAESSLSYDCEYKI